MAQQKRIYRPGQTKTKKQETVTKQAVAREKKEPWGGHKPIGKTAAKEKQRSQTTKARGSIMVKEAFGGKTSRKVPEQPVAKETYVSKRVATPNRLKNVKKDTQRTASRKRA